MTNQHRVREQTITYIECSVCGIPIAMTPAQERGYREAGDKFYCVLGHVLSFTETELMRSKKALIEAQDQVQCLETARDNLDGMLTTEIKKHRALKERIHNGVCPHCRRSFKNLQRHMDGQHADAKPRARRKG